MNLTIRLTCDSGQLFDWITLEAVDQGPVIELARRVVHPGEDLLYHLMKVELELHSELAHLGYVDPGRI